MNVISLIEQLGVSAGESEELLSMNLVEILIFSSPID